MTSYLYRFPNILDLLASQTIHLKIWVASLTPQWKLNPSWVNAKLANSAARRQQHKTFSLSFSRAAPLLIPRSYQTNTIVAIIPTNAFFYQWDRLMTLNAQHAKTLKLFDPQKSFFSMTLQLFVLDLSRCNRFIWMTLHGLYLPCLLPFPFFFFLPAQRRGP